MSTLKRFLDEEIEIKDIKKLAKSINRLKIEWLSKGDHSLWYYNGTLGEHKILMTQDDMTQLYDLVNVDEDRFKKKLKHVDGVEVEHKTVTVPYYLIGLYITIKFLDAGMDDAADDMMRLIYFRMASSLYHRDFGMYKLDPTIAKLAYEKCTKEVLVKRYGSWEAVIDYYIDKYLEDNWYVRSKTMETDEILLTISDIQTKIRRTITSFVSVIYNTKKEVKYANDIREEITDIDGEVKIRDSNSSETVIAVLKRELNSKSEFLDMRVVKVVASLYKEDDAELIKLVDYLIDKNLKGDGRINTIIANIIKYSSNYLYTKYGVADIPMDDCIQSVKNYYLNSRFAPPEAGIGKGLLVEIMGEVPGNEFTKGRRTRLAYMAIIYIYIKGLIIDSK